MRRKAIAGLAAAALAAGAVTAAVVTADDDGYTGGWQVADPVTAVSGADAGVTGRAAAARKPRKGKKGKRPTVQYFYARNALIPPEGGGMVLPVRCPKGEPIGGGARTTVGLVVNYLSRVNPQTGQTPKRTYYIGVEDISGSNPAGSGALVEIQCARGMKVISG